jgi:translation elongation factor P/translation initiation factor 5A
VKQCSDLRKGDYAIIKHHPCEVLAAFALDPHRFYIKVRLILAGQETEFKLPPTHDAKLFSPVRKEYALVRLIFSAYSPLAFLALADRNLFVFASSI